MAILVKKLYTMPVGKEVIKGGFYLADLTVYEVQDGTKSQVVCASTFYPWRKKIQELAKILLGDSLDYGYVMTEVQGTDEAFKGVMLTFEEWASLCLCMEDLDRGTESWLLGQGLYDVFRTNNEFMRWYERGLGLKCADRQKVHGFEEVDQKTKTEVVKTDKQLDRLYRIAGKLESLKVSKEDREFLITMMMNYKKVINLGKRISDFEYVTKDLMRFDELTKKLKLDVS